MNDTFSESRSSVRSLLVAWQSGKVDEQFVHEAAEELEAGLEAEGDFPRSDPRSILKEVVSQLSILNHQLVIRADIPEILRFLDAPQGEELQGWSRWSEYWDSQDYEQRAKDLAGTYYAV